MATELMDSGHDRGGDGSTPHRGGEARKERSQRAARLRSAVPLEANNSMVACAHPKVSMYNLYADDGLRFDSEQCIHF